MARPLMVPLAIAPKLGKYFGEKRSSNAERNILLESLRSDSEVTPSVRTSVSLETLISQPDASVIDEVFLFLRTEMQGNCGYNFELNN